MSFNFIVGIHILLVNGRFTIQLNWGFFFFLFGFYSSIGFLLNWLCFDKAFKLSSDVHPTSDFLLVKNVEPLVTVLFAQPLDIDDCLADFITPRDILFHNSERDGRALVVDFDWEFLLPHWSLVSFGMCLCPKFLVLVSDDAIRVHAAPRVRVSL